MKMDLMNLMAKCSLRRADPSPRGVAPNAVCHCVWYRNLKNEAALAAVGLLLYRKEKMAKKGTFSVRGRRY